MATGVQIPVGHGLHIAVDFWQNTKKAVLAHFLTHMHSDHTEGLRDDWRRGPIFCSFETKHLLQVKWPGVAVPVTPLAVGETHSLRLQQGGSREVAMNVTLLDAAHCAGAVMFLFEGSFGRVLHTGDFRWEEEVYQQGALHPALTYAPIDALYLDNTYCHPRYEFPRRSQALQEVLALIRSHPDHEVLLGVDTLGKEELLSEVAGALGAPVRIPPERQEVVRLLGLPPERFTLDRGSRVRAIPRWQVTLDNVAKRNRLRPTLAIVPSGFAGVPASPPSVAPLPAAPAIQQACASFQHPAAAPGGSGVTPAEGRAASAACTVPAAAPTKLAAYAALLHAIQVPLLEAWAPATAQELAAARPLLRRVPYTLHNSFSELARFVAAVRPRAIRGIVLTPTSPAHPTDPALHFAHLLRPAPATPSPIVPQQPLFLESSAAPAASISGVEGQEGEVPRSGAGRGQLAGSCGAEAAHRIGRLVGGWQALAGVAIAQRLCLKRHAASTALKLNRSSGVRLCSSDARSGFQPKPLLLCPQPGLEKAPQTLADVTAVAITASAAEAASS